MDKYYEINNRIKSNELRVITSAGENLGVLKTAEALKMARDNNLDLVVITPNSVPPVAKMLDFKKFLYQERKKKSTAKVKSKKSELKEIRFGPHTGDGDINRHIERAKEFLQDGNRVKVTVIMRGRENLYPSIAFQKLDSFISAMQTVAKQEAGAKQNGTMISTVFVAK